MKKLFLLGILGLGVIWGVGYFLYRIVLACMDVYEDWQLAKEVRQIEAEAAAKRRQRQSQAGAERERLQHEAQQLE